MRAILPLAFPLVLVLSLAAPSDAQCTGPDGFSSGPCCSDITPNLPLFPLVVNQQSQGVCWTSCNVSSTECLVVDMSPPVPAGKCGEFFTQFTASDCSFTPVLSGLLDLTYMRTWEEDDVAGVPVQVWRFHAKIDLFEVSLAPPICPNPPCATLTTSAFFYGYVDYALNCATNTWETAVVLFHNCDEFIHQPGLSSTPGTFHPTQTFAIVSPDTSTNPFVATPIAAPPLAALTSEAMRVVSDDPTQCLAEERMVAGTWFPLLSGCACPLGLVSTNTAVAIDGAGFCGSNFSSLFIGNLPWLYLVTTSLGTWTTDLSYPGIEEVSVAEGIILEQHGCLTPTYDTVSLYYGSVTDGGYVTAPAFTQTFVDLASNYSEVVPGPYLPPFVGNVIPSENLIYFNL